MTIKTQFFIIIYMIHNNKVEVLKEIINKRVVMILKVMGIIKIKINNRIEVMIVIVVE